MNNWRKISISTSLGAVFFLSATILLFNGHLHEDAYILFQYSKKVSIGEGIVFDALSGHTEGATDFLWMIALALIHRMGLDIGTAAALLNSLGLAVTAYVILKLNDGFDWKSISGLFLIIFSGGLAAALGGFSTLAYGGLFALFAYSVMTNRFKTISLLAIVIPLFRPDGLLLVLGGVATTLFFSSKLERKKFIIYLFPAIVIGIYYFVWRVNYFDSILPLPLLVKARTDKLLEGLGQNFLALRWYLLLLLIPFVMLLIKREFRQVSWQKYFALGLGPFLLLTALSFAHQSQNVGYRFQYPIVVSFVLMFVISCKEIGVTNKIFLAPIFVCILSGAKIIYRDVIYLTNNDYINSFPQILKLNNFEANKIAITEAGRFPFWYDAQEMIDLVGLNSIQVVKKGSAQVLNDTKPNLIFIHHTGRFDMSEFETDKPFFITNSKSIKIKNEYMGKNPIFIAPESALNYAIENKFIAIPVRYGSEDENFSHVYFLSPILNKELFIAALEQSWKIKLTYHQSNHN